MGNRETIGLVQGVYGFGTGRETIAMDAGRL